MHLYHVTDLFKTHSVVRMFPLRGYWIIPPRRVGTELTIKIKVKAGAGRCERQEVTQSCGVFMLCMNRHSYTPAQQLD